MKLFFLISLFSSLAFANSQIYFCESGDPSGNGPRAMISLESSKASEFHVQWNPRDIGKRPTFDRTFHSRQRKPSNFVEIDGERYRHTVYTLSRSLNLEFFKNLPEDGNEFSFAVLVSNTHRFPNTVMSCQGN